MVSTNVAELYDIACCTLWVEDELTRVVLSDFWDDVRIRVYSAAGRSGVEHLVRAAPRSLVGRNVVGLVDRDFSQPGSQDWTNPGRHVLYTPVHEFENLLLDFKVLGALSGRDDAVAIEAEAKAFAERLKWWMVCKRVRHDFYGAVSAHFPEEPAVPSRGSPMDRDAAVAHLRESDYRKKHSAVLRTWSDVYIEQRMVEWSAVYDADLASGEWTRSFSGKEIFHHLRGEMKGLSALAKSKTATQNDEDLGKSFARLLRRRFKNTSPTAQVLDDLRAALRVRAGLKA